MNMNHPLAPLIILITQLFILVFTVFISIYGLAIIIGQKQGMDTWTKKQFAAIWKKHGKLIVGILLGILIMIIINQPAHQQ